MGVVVQKFGGTSVATAEKIMRAAQRAISAKLEGHHVAVVVSARGHTTDELIDLAKEIHPDPPARELDMLMATGEQVSIALLAMAIEALGHRAISLTGGQVGIVTDSIHGKARIQQIQTTRLQNVFEQGMIAIIAGFQGMDELQNITTLGRGGSDTTAVAIAAALNADACEIYTDVDGVYTTDPRVVPEARKIEQISYDEMLELASVGAGVMHSRSIEFAKKFGTIIHVRHAGKESAGTLIRPEDPTMEHVVVRGAALSTSEARITIRDVPDKPGMVHRIFAKIAQAHIIVDMIVQNVAVDGRTEVSFTVGETDLNAAKSLAEEVSTEIGASGVESSQDVAKVSIVGLGMRTHTGVADRMFRAIAAEDINIRMITTSDIKISVLVSRARGADALRAVHREFELQKPLPEQVMSAKFKLVGDDLGNLDNENRLREIVKNLPRMEDIIVSNVHTVENQARVTLLNVPDRPGIASKIFERVASAGVPVDMIVQDVGSAGQTMISFSVLRRDLIVAEEQSTKVMQDIAGGGSVFVDDSMVKISVRGVGMRSHTGVAVRVFQALADAKINVQLINTSELHITVIVARDSGEAAVAALRQAFEITS